MASPPALLLAHHALPPTLQAVPHIPQLISEYLIPATIDAAVYHDLQRVLQVYEPFRPYTVGAMDGAAARGLLHVVSQLRETRGEGCSTAAFIGAAANGHLDMLEWLRVNYPTLCRPVEELKAAAANDQVEIVRFLLRNGSVRYEDQVIAFVVAVANGHVAVSEVFLGVIGFSRDAVVAAAANNQVSILRLLMQRDPNDCSYLALPEALEKAVEGGNVDASELLIEAADEWSIKTVLEKAAMTMRADVLRLILERCPVSDRILASMLREAANANRCEIVELVLEKCPPMDRQYVSVPLSSWHDHEKRRPTDSAIGSAMLTAADKDQLEMLQILLPKGGWYAGDVLGSALRNDKWQVVRLVLKVCDKHYLEDTELKQYAGEILEMAAADDDVEMAELLFSKCGVLIETHHRALHTAVQRNSRRMLPLLAAKSEPSRVVDAFITAAGRGQVEMVALLLTHIDQEAIEGALEKAATYGNVAASELLLTRCSPVAYKRIFHKAATSDSAGVVQLLLDQMDCCSINRALASAAARGYTAVVKVLVGKADAAAISCALEVAAIEAQLQVIELLRRYCDPDGIRNAAAKARVVGCDEVVALLSSKKARRE